MFERIRQTLQELLTDKRIPDEVDKQLDIVGRDDYLYEFEQDVKEDVLMIGNISLDEIKVRIFIYDITSSLLVDFVSFFEL